MSLADGVALDPRLAEARRVAHVTLQPLASDARVNRALQAMREAGIDCPVVGPGSGVEEGVMGRRAKAEIGAAFGAARLLGAGRAGRAAARGAFFSRPQHRQARRALVEARPDAIHAHDWDGLLVADDAARALGVPFVYDAHEFASQMHSERRAWRAVVAPLIRRMEGPAARRAACVVTVGDALGRLLHEHLDLAAAPVTVRNIPDTARIAPVPRAGRAIRLLYHGVLAEGRGIEALVEGVLAAAAPCRLVLRGPWRQERLRLAVEAHLAAHPNAARVEITPPLPFAELVTAAAECDLGVCLLDGSTLHNRISLPNKLFEYLHAGLALLTSGSDEMQAVVASYGCGVDLGSSDAAAVSSFINSTDREAVDRWRMKAAIAAQELCWVSERKRLLAVYGRD